MNARLATSAPIRIELSIPNIDMDALTTAIAEKLALLKGKKLPDGVYRIDGTDLLYTTSRDETFPHKGADQWAKSLPAIPGYSAWDLMEKREVALLIDDTRFNPAVNTEIHPGIGAYWYWLKRVDASSSSFARFVYFYGGLVGDGYRVNRLRALAVCRPVPASQ